MLVSVMVFVSRLGRVELRNVMVSYRLICDVYRGFGFVSV